MINVIILNFRYQYFDSCCGRLRDEHLLGVAFFKCVFTITIQLQFPMLYFPSSAMAVHDPGDAGSHRLPRIHQPLRDES